MKIDSTTVQLIVPTRPVPLDDILDPPLSQSRCWARRSGYAAIAEIVIDRPERHNAMTPPMYEEMLKLVDECNAQPAIRCVLLRGMGGKSFISGTDISYFKDFSSGRQGLEYEAFVERVVDAVERIAVRTIAAIDGWTVGAGLALATACDFRLCSDVSRFGAPIAKTLSNTLSSRNLARLVTAFLSRGAR